ncbi:type III pantothenate kinase [Colwellia sp. D2M02]|uniref:type III pantothenate kinase n=1 Tax=Colwellia sp. D2M02 TaxID=2841562 RepID=UPI001C0A15E6|nr:type III pantothenate kinase [Colwellia sp. D2M02]
MILLIDIGNSRVKYALLNNVNTQHIENIHSIENLHFNHSFINNLCVVDNQVSQVIVASVANSEIVNPIVEYCIDHHISYTEVKSERCKNGVVSGYQIPEQLGVDRWLAIIGAQQRYAQQNILVIDAGTATTFDLVDNTGQHRGGWIFAGITTLYNTLLQNTAHIKAETKRDIELSFGLNTTDNVNNCCWAATVGLINQAILQAERELGAVERIIITGGNAPALTTLTNVEMVYIEALVFYGLQQYIT